jgi:hypothetical protein
MIVEFVVFYCTDRCFASGLLSMVQENGYDEGELGV